MLHDRSDDRRSAHLSYPIISGWMQGQGEMDDVRKCERLQALKREVGRGKGRWILAWRGHTAETKGWTEWEGKEGMESERDDVRESKRNAERWGK